MNKRDQLEELYKRREGEQKYAEHRRQIDKALDDSIAQLERDLGIEPEKPSVWERLNKIVKGG